LAGVTMAGENPRVPALMGTAPSTIVTIAGRADAPARNAVYWNTAGVGTLNGAAGSWAIMVGRAGTNGWTTLDTAALSQAQFPMGAAIEVRNLGTPGAALVPITGSTVSITPGATAARVRIPAIPRAPGAPRVRNNVVTVPAAQQFTWLPNVAALATFDMTTATWTAGADITLTATHTNQVLVTRLAPVSADAGRHRPASFPRATLITEAMVPTAPAAP